MAGEHELDVLLLDVRERPGLAWGAILHDGWTAPLRAPGPNRLDGTGHALEPFARAFREEAGGADPRNANASASLASDGTPSDSAGASRAGASRRASADMSAGLRTPPPLAYTASTPPRGARNPATAAATAEAISSTAVAI